MNLGAAVLILAIFGAVLVTGGVYALAGLGYALVTLGAFSLAGSVTIARGARFG
jgi:hypothetical protein